MFRLNDRGFTLVELLAVIVVLAIMMAIAIPNVMKTMENAKKSTLKIYAQKVMTKAEEAYQVDILLKGQGKTCYDLASLGIESSGNYRGKVLVTIAANQNPTYYIYLSDNSNSIENLDAATLNKLGSIDNDPNFKNPWIGQANIDNSTCS